MKKYSPRGAEYNLLRKKAHKSNKNRLWWNITDKIEVEEEEFSPIMNYAQYFMTILANCIMPAILQNGDGEKHARLTRVKINFSNKHTSDTLTPLIKWCVYRQHVNKSRNPCRYFITIGEDNTFTVNMSCFGVEYTVIFTRGSCRWCWIRRRSNPLSTMMRL